MYMTLVSRIFARRVNFHESSTILPLHEWRLQGEPCKVMHWTFGRWEPRCRQAYLDSACFGPAKGSTIGLKLSVETSYTTASDSDMRFPRTVA
jgi:hypothetical protein